MAWKLCTSGSAILDAGVNANATIIAASGSLAIWSEQSEGRICAECHYDFVANFDSLDTEIKNAIEDIVSAMIGMKIVGYDLSGYSLLREAETILDILDERIYRGTEVLKLKVNQKLGEA